MKVTLNVWIVFQVFLLAFEPALVYAGNAKTPLSRNEANRKLEEDPRGLDPSQMSNMNSLQLKNTVQTYQRYYNSPSFKQDISKGIVMQKGGGVTIPNLNMVNVRPGQVVVQNVPQTPSCNTLVEMGVISRGTGTIGAIDSSLKSLSADPTLKGIARDALGLKKQSGAGYKREKKKDQEDLEDGEDSEGVKLRSDADLKAEGEANALRPNGCTDADEGVDLRPGGCTEYTNLPEDIDRIIADLQNEKVNRYCIAKKGDIAEKMKACFIEMQGNVTAALSSIQQDLNNRIAFAESQLSPANEMEQQIQQRLGFIENQLGPMDPKTGQRSGGLTQVYQNLEGLFGGVQLSGKGQGGTTQSFDDVLKTISRNNSAPDEQTVLLNNRVQAQIQIEVASCIVNPRSANLPNVNKLVCKAGSSHPRLAENTMDYLGCLMGDYYNPNAVGSQKSAYSAEMKRIQTAFESLQYFMRTGPRSVDQVRARIANLFPPEFPKITQALQSGFNTCQAVVEQRYKGTYVTGEDGVRRLANKGLLQTEGSEYYQEVERIKRLRQDSLDENAKYLRSLASQYVGTVQGLEAGKAPAGRRDPLDLMSSILPAPGGATKYDLEAAIRNCSVSGAQQNQCLQNIKQGMAKLRYEYKTSYDVPVGQGQTVKLECTGVQLCYDMLSKTSEQGRQRLQEISLAKKNYIQANNAMIQGELRNKYKEFAKNQLAGLSAFTTKMNEFFGDLGADPVVLEPVQDDPNLDVAKDKDGNIVGIVKPVSDPEKLAKFIGPPMFKRPVTSFERAQSVIAKAKGRSRKGTVAEVTAGINAYQSKRAFCLKEKEKTEKKEREEALKAKKDKVVAAVSGYQTVAAQAVSGCLYSKKLTPEKFQGLIEAINSAQVVLSGNGMGESSLLNAQTSNEILDRAINNMDEDPCTKLAQVNRAIEIQVEKITDLSNGRLPAAEGTSAADALAAAREAKAAFEEKKANFINAVDPDLETHCLKGRPGIANNCDRIFNDLRDKGGQVRGAVDSYNSSQGSTDDES